MKKKFIIISLSVIGSAVLIFAIGFGIIYLSGNTEILMKLGGTEADISEREFESLKEGNNEVVSSKEQVSSDFQSNGEEYVADFDELKSSLPISNEVVSFGKETSELNIIYGKEVYEAMKGTHTWTYNNGDGTFETICADSMHPLEAKEYMPEIPFLYSTLSHIDPIAVYLKFEWQPTEVTARCWKSSDWGNTDADSESVEVDVLDNEYGEPQHELKLKENSNIYEITARWEGNDETGGTVTYYFCISDSLSINSPN